MVMVKCKACGKRYDNKQHGCCPECGAYNRPPRRNRVGTDGVVYHMSDNEFLDNSRHRRRSQGEKVCFEQDVCYEDQARKVRSGGKPWEEPLNAGLSWLQQQGKKRHKKEGKKPVGAAIAVAVLVSILPTILSTCMKIVDNLDIGSGLEEIFTETVPAKPDRKPDQIYVSRDAVMGEKFLWWDAETVVTGVAIGTEEAEYSVVVTLMGEDVGDSPQLFYALPDGTVVCEDVGVIEEVTQGAEYTLYFAAPDMDVYASCYLEFAGYNGDEYCTTTVILQ